MQINSLLWFGIGFLVLFGGMGFLLILIGLVNADKADVTHEWPVVQGVVTQSSMRAHRSSNRHRHGGVRTHYSYEPVVEYDYTVNGVPYTSARIGYGAYRFNQEQCQEFLAQYPARTMVQVHYDPEHPQSAVLETGAHGQIGLYIVGGILLLSGFVAGGMTILQALKP
ncbi:MAG: DUF3592 domain-containing protein [Chloroflexi bacterium]|nr:DUF3592 domain-containing protein [Chloroflexota bacterium]